MENKMVVKNTCRILSEEHQNILKVIGILNKECDTIELGKDINKKFFEDVIDFIRNYADKFHHAKEEDILFKELCEDSIQDNLHCNPVDQMLHEHDLGRNFVEGMEDGLRENNKAEIIENARAYCQLLQEHIFKEDNVLYPMADLALRGVVRKAILNKFRQIGIKKKGLKAQYLGIIKKLIKENEKHKTAN